jgi:hypothetical protein
LSTSMAVCLSLVDSSKVLCLRMHLPTPSWSLGLPACSCFIGFCMVTGAVCQRRKDNIRSCDN